MAKASTPLAAAEKNAATAVKAGPASVALPRFMVRLDCPTPLLYRSLVLESATDEEAWAKFMSLNGISGSSHTRTIEPTTENVTELKQ